MPVMDETRAARWLGTNPLRSQSEILALEQGTARERASFAPRSLK